MPRLIDEATGEVAIAKVPSTPADPAIGFLAASERILREQGVSPDAVGYVVHGTTVATNAVIEGTIAPTGFITTEGFRDMLEIARQVRPSLYDLRFEKPKPLVPRNRCAGVPERLDATGQILTPLDEEAVREAARHLRREGVESIAVCFLHSYVNPAHERRAGDLLREVFPEADDLPFLRRRTGVSRVLPCQHDRDQRRDPADRRQLSRADRGGVARGRATTPSCW